MLILLTAMCYEEDTGEREYILFDACRRVYQYSHSFDMEGEAFVKNGFQDFSSGKWNPQKTEAAEPATVQETVSEPQSEPTEDLAVMLAELLRRDDLPEELSEAIKDGITDLYNSRVDQSEINEFQDSPEYIEMILRGYRGKTK